MSFFSIRVFGLAWICFTLKSAILDSMAWPLTLRVYVSLYIPTSYANLAMWASLLGPSVLVAPQHRAPIQNLPVPVHGHKQLRSDIMAP